MKISPPKMKRLRGMLIVQDQAWNRVTDNQHRAVYKKYRELDPKKRDAFSEKHANEIQQYRDAKQYLDAVMNGRSGLPVKEWKTEQAKLTVEKFSLCEDYYRLKDETRSVEVLRRGAENIMREDGRERQSHRTQGMEIS